MSFGGSSIVANCIALAVLLRVDWENRQLMKGYTDMNKNCYHKIVSRSFRLTHTILIMAGGTGGHVFPALAVADYLKKAGWRIVWLGTKGGMEESLVLQKGHDIKFIDFSGLRGKNLMVWFTLPVRLLLAFWQSAKLLFQLRPDVVLGMGGYPAFPGGIMASLLNKPLLIHEQNSIPGLTNKILVKFADKVLTGFPDSIRDKKKVVFSGNPVRNEISQLDAFRIIGMKDEVEI